VCLAPGDVRLGRIWEERRQGIGDAETYKPSFLIIMPRIGSRESLEDCLAYAKEIAASRGFPGQPVIDTYATDPERSAGR
jgi:hypothetical protein